MRKLENHNWTDDELIEMAQQMCIKLGEIELERYEFFRYWLDRTSDYFLYDEEFEEDLRNEILKIERLERKAEMDKNSCRYKLATWWSRIWKKINDCR